MFYEFAVEPELVANWCDRVGYKGFLTQFGLDTSRIVSKYPAEWNRSVYDAFSKIYQFSTYQQRKRRDEILSHLGKRMVKRYSENFEANLPWLENVEREHCVRPFKGIVARTNPRNCSSVSVINSAEDILERLEPLPRDCDANRTPDALVTPLIPLLRCCEYAIFVDPHFDIKLRYLEPLQKRLCVIVNERFGSKNPKIQLHTSIERNFKPSDTRSPDIERRSADDLFSKLRAKLPSIIPSGLNVRIVIWKEKERGEKLHNRYLLTDIGSVAFGTGLDCNDEAFHKELAQGQSDDIFCLSENLHKKRWEAYVSAPAFELVVEGIIVGRSL